MLPNKNRIKRLMPPKKRLSAVEQIEFLEEFSNASKVDSEESSEMIEDSVSTETEQQEEAKDQEPKGPITSYLESIHTHRRSKKAHFTVLCLVLILGSLGFWLLNDKSFDINRLSVPIVNDLEEGETDPRVLIAKKAEERVRSIEGIEDSEKIRNTLLINSEEALASFKEAFQNEVGASAEVDDLYLIFETKKVLYRPSSDQVVLAS